jgi:hypothetical protein
VPLETFSVFNERWNNKFYYKVHLVGYFYWVISNTVDSAGAFRVAAAATVDVWFCSGLWNSYLKPQGENWLQKCSTFSSYFVLTPQQNARSYFFKPFPIQFFCQPHIPQLLFVLGGKEVGGLLVIILQF